MQNEVEPHRISKVLRRTETGQLYTANKTQYVSNFHTYVRLPWRSLTRLLTCSDEDFDRSIKMLVGPPPEEGNSLAKFLQEAKLLNHTALAPLIFPDGGAARQALNYRVLKKAPFTLEEKKRAKKSLDALFKAYKKIDDWDLSY